MAIVTTDDSHYKAIADVIRDRGGDAVVEVFEKDTFTPSEMADAVGVACDTTFDEGVGVGYDDGLATGIEDGFSEGYSTGHAEGFDEGKAEGITEGIQTEYDRFWDAFQWNGTRTDYRYAFAGFGWTTDNFRPKYPIAPTGAAGHMFNSNQIKDLRAHMETYGIVVDTSAATNCEQFFMGSIVETYGVLDASACANLNYLLYNAKQMRSITKIIIKNDGSQTVSSFALNCNALVDVTIEGVFGQTGLSFQQSTKLSKASITSVVNALSSTTSGLSVTFSKTAVNAAFTTAEWTALAATKSNWTINLV